jgi:hypothetical protein
MFPLHDILKAGEEWRPRFPPTVLQQHLEKPIDLPKDFIMKIQQSAKDHIRDKEIKERLEKARGAIEDPRIIIIEDPLAFYVPYHSSRMGIYFRLNKMLSDFQIFISKIVWPEGSRPSLDRLDDLWHIYVMTIFWHEMAHHVLEDVATIMEWMKTGKYPLIPQQAEERFCEFMAFTTSEIQLSIPRRFSPIPLIYSHRLPSGLGNKHNRDLILSALYYHWGRNDPTSAYRPVIEPVIPQTLNGLWNAFWNAHRGGYKVLKVPDEIYEHVYVTTL